MKIVYPNGAIGSHMPYQYQQFKTKDQFELSKNVYELNKETNEYLLVGKDNCTVEWELSDINYIAGEYIKKYYPEYKQLNIIRTGSDSEKLTMNTFIDTVRAWANSSNPDPWSGALEQIIP